MGEMVRAKFECKSVEGAGGYFDIRLEPVYGESGENAKFWNATPSGEISLTTTNEAAAKQFEKGREYYVDFTPADGIGEPKVDEKSEHHGGLLSSATTLVVASINTSNKPDGEVGSAVKAAAKFLERELDA